MNQTTMFNSKPNCVVLLSKFATTWMRFLVLRSICSVFFYLVAVMSSCSLRSSLVQFHRLLDYWWNLLPDCMFIQGGDSSVFSVLINSSVHFMPPVQRQWVFGSVSKRLEVLNKEIQQQNTLFEMWADTSLPAVVFFVCFFCPCDCDEKSRKKTKESRGGISGWIVWSAASGVMCVSGGEASIRRQNKHTFPELGLRVGVVETSGLVIVDFNFNVSVPWIRKR